MRAVLDPAIKGRDMNGNPITGPGKALAFEASSLCSDLGPNFGACPPGANKSSKNRAKFVQCLPLWRGMNHQSSMSVGVRNMPSCVYELSRKFLRDPLISWVIRIKSWQTNEETFSNIKNLYGSLWEIDTCSRDMLDLSQACIRVKQIRLEDVPRVIILCDGRKHYYMVISVLPGERVYSDQAEMSLVRRKKDDTTKGYYTGYPKDLGPSRVIHFTSEREFVQLLHEDHSVVVAFTIRSNYTKHFDKVLEEAAVEFYPHVKFMRVRYN
ncbi:hypothetical protein HHK36_030914 [Tetracentron sinense]|uniref:Uncharacterized protein n=1 Tax=Tetracentron sinense TaxID=13715 RepID=A0A835CZ39_TETSI|nr:hypothetical protein HHK36_030914 [Tetracentron sinense]